MASVADQMQDPIAQSPHEQPDKVLTGRVDLHRLTGLLSANHWKAWSISAGAAVALAVVASMAVFHNAPVPDEQQARILEYARSEAEPAIQRPMPISKSSGYALRQNAEAPKAAAEMYNGPLTTRSTPPSLPQAPMIARTASLTILVKDFAASRASLDAILARYGGYSANLTVDTPGNGQRHFQASFRIPANQLDSALNDLKKLGRTLNESQSGEEVTQQHADLVARLQNSRETEQRMRAILEQRTGKIDDVLQVEEEIARVRGEIESMEAEQKALEHRVTYARVDLQLVEEYKEAFTSSPVSAAGRVRNAFVEGVRNAAASVLGLVLFLEEFRPAMFIWAVILGLPVYLVWRRRRKVHAQV